MELPRYCIRPDSTMLNETNQIQIYKPHIFHSFLSNRILCTYIKSCVYICVCAHVCVAGKQKGHDQREKNVIIKEEMARLNRLKVHDVLERVVYMKSNRVNDKYSFINAKWRFVKTSLKLSLGVWFKSQNN